MYVIFGGTNINENKFNWYFISLFLLDFQFINIVASLSTKNYTCDNFKNNCQTSIDTF